MRACKALKRTQCTNQHETLARSTPRALNATMLPFDFRLIVINDSARNRLCAASTRCKAVADAVRLCAKLCCALLARGGGAGAQGASGVYVGCEAVDFGADENNPSRTQVREGLGHQAIRDDGHGSRKALHAVSALFRSLVAVLFRSPDA
eukprot:6185973-Pleurochrysis_carterae.AAC.1